MENITYSGTILYEFCTSLQNRMLEITLKVTNERGIQNYKTILTEESLPPKLQIKFEKVENLFTFFQDKKNFLVDVLRGEILLINQIGHIVRLRL